MQYEILEKDIALYLAQDQKNKIVGFLTQENLYFIY
jgi:hypothetical protein